LIMPNKKSVRPVMNRGILAMITSAYSVKLWFGVSVSRRS
jgi:hypothetical protein